MAANSKSSDKDNQAAQAAAEAKAAADAKAAAEKAAAEAAAKAAAEKAAAEVAAKAAAEKAAAEAAAKAAAEKAAAEAAAKAAADAKHDKGNDKGPDHDKNDEGSKQTKSDGDAKHDGKGNDDHDTDDKGSKQTKSDGDAKHDGNGNDDHDKDDKGSKQTKSDGDDKHDKDDKGSKQTKSDGDDKHDGKSDNDHDKDDKGSKQTKGDGDDRHGKSDNDHDKDDKGHKDDGHHDRDDHDGRGDGDRDGDDHHGGNGHDGHGEEHEPAPVLTAHDAVGLEDTAVPLSITLTDADHDAQLSIKISGVPAGAHLSAGQDLGNGVWLLTVAQLQGLSLIPTHNFHDSFTLTVAATATEQDGDDRGHHHHGGRKDDPDANGDRHGRGDGDDRHDHDDHHGRRGDDSDSNGDRHGRGDGDDRHGHDDHHGHDHDGHGDHGHHDDDDTVTVTASLHVSIAAVADAPNLGVSNATGDENTSIPLSIASSLNDAGEQLAITIGGVPAGSTLSAGHDNGDGTWTLAPADLANLTLTPPNEFEGTIQLTVTATSTEPSDGDHASVSQALTITVNGVAEPPVVDVHDVSGHENSSIGLDFSAALVEDDGNDTLSIVVSGVPSGASLSAGHDNGDGSWTLTPVDLTNLTISPPHDFVGTFDLTVTATDTDQPGGNTASTTASFHVTTTALAEPPVIGAHDVSGNEDTSIALDLNVALSPDDPNGSLSITISGVPSGASLSAGHDNGDGTWSLNSADLANLTITPPHEFEGQFQLEVTATDTSGSTSASTSASFNVTAIPVADAPVLSVGNATLFQDNFDQDNGGQPTLNEFNLANWNVTQGSVDLIGNGSFDAYQGNGLYIDTAGTTNQYGTIETKQTFGPGTYTLHLDLGGPIYQGITDGVHVSFGNYSEDFVLNGLETQSITRTITLDHASALSIGDLGLSGNTDIGATLFGVSITGAQASGDEDTAIALGINAALAEDDGTDQLSILISGVPSGAHLSAGHDNGDGSWSLAQSDLAGLTITPPTEFEGQFQLTVTATSTEPENGSTANTTQTLNVVVNPVAEAPLLSVGVTGFSDNFDQENGGHGTLNDSNFANWNVTHGSVDLIGNGFFDAYSGNGLYVDMAGSTGQYGALETKTTFGPGSYTLHLDLAGAIVQGVTDGVHVNFGNYSEDFTLNALETQSITRTITLDHASTLSISDLGLSGNPNIGATLLGVSLQGAASGDEDTAIALNINAALAEDDGTDQLSVLISGVPSGAHLSVGHDNGDGTWLLAQNDLAGLTIMPPEEFEGNFQLTVTATSTEPENGSHASTTQTLNVIVNPVAEAPLLSVGNGTVFSDNFDQENGGQGTLNDFNLANWNVTQGSVDAIGNGFFDAFPGNGLYLDMAGTTNQYGAIETKQSFGPGTYTLHLDLAGTIYQGITDGVHVSFGGYSEDFVLNGLETQSITRTITLDHASTLSISDLGLSGNTDIGATLLGVSIAGAQAIGDEDTAIALNINASLVENDGTDQLAVVVAGVPSGAHLSAGHDNGDGTWTLAPGDLTNLSITPPVEFEGQFQLTVTATSTEPENGSHASTSQTLNVIVNPVADAPTLEVHNVEGNENSAIALDVSSALVENDGTDQFSLVISGVPSGASLSAGHDNGDGSWTLTGPQLSGLTISPPHDFHGTFTLSVTATSTEPENGSTASVSNTFDVTVDATATPPALSAHDTSGDEDTAIPLDITAALQQGDPGTLSVTVSDLPPGAHLSAGQDNGDGTWTLTPADLTGLTLTPPVEFEGNIALTITASATEPDTSVNSTTSTVNITVNPVAEAPVLTVSDASGDEDTAIALNISSALSEDDGNETLSVTISGVPAGASLSAGQDNGNGSWTLSPVDLAHLTITPPADFESSFDLTVVATETDGPTSSATSTGTIHVTVNPVAEAPALVLHDANGDEDTVIGLDLSAALVHPDATDELSILISGVPSGAQLSAGQDNGDGSWSLTAADLAHLSITPPNEFEGQFQLTITATATEPENGSNASSTGAINVVVNPVAEAPLLTLQDVSANEDTAVVLGRQGHRLNLSASLSEDDGTDQLTVNISGLPPGATLSAGVHNADGSWTVTPDEIPDLTLIPPSEFEGSFQLTIAAISTEPENGSTASTTGIMNVTIVPVADAPFLAVHDASGAENQPIGLDVTASLVEDDGNDGLSILISGVPLGAHLSAGQDNGNGSWTLTGPELSGLTLTPPANFSGALELTVTATSIELENGSTADTMGTVQVTVTPVAETPELTIANASGDEDTVIPLDITAALQPGDAGALSITISGVPTGALLSAGQDNGDGTWTLTPADLTNLSLTPPTEFEGAIHLSVTATSIEPDTTTASTTGAIDVTVNPVAEAPVLTVSDTAGNEDTAITLNIASALSENDGNETLSITVSGVPSGATLSAGQDNGNGSWTLAPADLTNLSITPAHSFTGVISLTVVATETDGPLSSATTSGTVNVTVNAVGLPPDTIDSAISMSENTVDHPTSANGFLAATDPDDAVASFTILQGPQHGQISSFDAQTGAYTYTPDQGFSGTDTFTFQATDQSGHVSVQPGNVDINVAHITAPETAVNELAGFPFQPQITTLGDGSFVAVWSEILASPQPGQDGGIGVWAQRFTAGGQAIGHEFQVNTIADDSQFDPQVAALANGDYLISWRSAHSPDDPSGFGISMQRFSASPDVDGNPIFLSRDGTIQEHDEFTANQVTAGDQSAPVVTGLPDGGWLATWTDLNGNDGFGSSTNAGNGVFAQRFDASGNPVNFDGTAGPLQSVNIPDDIMFSQEEPDVIMLHGVNAGQFIVSYTSQQNPLADHDLTGQEGRDVFFKRYDTSGHTLDNETLVNDFTIGDQKGGHLTALDNGGFVATWHSINEDHIGESVYAKIYNPDGNGDFASGSEFQINTTTTGNEQFPDVTLLTDGNLLFVYQADGVDGSGSAIMAQKVDPLTGDKIGGEILVNTFSSGDQQLPEVTALSGGGFAVIWQTSQTPGNGGQGVEARVFGANDAGLTELRAGHGNDVLQGAFGVNNTLHGGPGNSLLIGADLHDTFIGGTGGDTFVGGTGPDTFVLDDPATETFSNLNDVITNFDGGKGDVLDLHTIAGFNGPVNGGNLDNFVRFVQSGQNTLVQVDSTGTGGSFHTSVVLQNFDPNQSGHDLHDLFNNGHIVV